MREELVPERPGTGPDVILKTVYTRGCHRKALNRWRGHDLNFRTFSFFLIK